MTSSSDVVHRLAMSWGIYGIIYDGDGSDEDRVDFAIAAARRLGQVESGDLIVMTAGSQRQAGSTNLISVVRAP